MAKIRFIVLDRFAFKGGFGMVLAGTALLIKGTGSRSGWKIEKGEIPSDALPIGSTSIPSEVNMAFNGAACAIAGVTSLNKRAYRILASRHDIPEHVVERFKADPVEDDKEARQKFDKLCHKPSHAWDDLRLERVDIEEQSTHITASDPDDRKE